MENQLKRPEGMHREVFNLLDRERNIASLMPSTTKNSGYRNQKARVSRFLLCTFKIYGHLFCDSI